MTPKSIREGGNNSRQIHLAGPVSYAQLTLKRGMTATFDLWDWFARAAVPGEKDQRGDALIKMMSSDGRRVDASFALTRCLPTKIKAPALNAMDGLVAIEEMQLAYETMRLKKPTL